MRVNNKLLKMIQYFKTKGNNHLVNIINKMEFRATVVTKEIEINPPVKVMRSSKKLEIMKNVLPNYGEHLKSILKEHLDSKTNKYKAIIKILSNVEVLTMAYELIKSNTGNTTVGTTGETLDGITKNWLNNISKELKEGKYTFNPSRRVLIPNNNGKLRPLGVTNPREKIVQKAITMILETIFEPIFSENSHGFRPNRSCHTALKQIDLKIKSGYSWVIEGDISKCFDSIPHAVIMEIIKEKIECNKTLTLIKRSLSAGYLDTNTNKIIKESIGTPQGSILSPLLCNIVLDKLDKFIDEIKINYEKGKTRKLTKEYHKIKRIPYNLRTSEQKNVPSANVMDKDYRRIEYVRYADDFIIGIIGSKEEAINIKGKIKEFLLNLGLNLSTEKTKITNFKEGFNFLGTHIFIRKYNKNKEQPFNISKIGGKLIKRRYHPRIVFHAPILDLLKKLRDKKFIKIKNKEIYPLGLSRLTTLDHSDILRYYNNIIRGLTNYYSFVDNKMCLSSIIRFLKYSCGLTLRRKYKLSTLRKTFLKFGYNFTCPKTKYSLNIPPAKQLNKSREFNINISIPQPEDLINKSWSNKLTQSNINKNCALCNTNVNIEMHHLKSVKDVRMKIKKGSNTFEEWKGAFLRKQIPLCSKHHDDWHNNSLNVEQLKILKKYQS